MGRPSKYPAELRERSVRMVMRRPASGGDAPIACQVGIGMFLRSL